MSEYPGIYKALDGAIYYYLNKKKFFSPERGRWEEDCDINDHKTDVNITAEYLTNTYGKVESKEHAEFIVKLAENAGFIFSSRRSGDNWFCFSSRHLFFYESESRASDNKEKTITIPLPPKESLMPYFNVETPMPKVKEPKKVSMNDIQINVNNNTDSIVQVTKSDDESNIFIHVNDSPKGEEWPVNGCECIYNGELYYFLCDSPFADVAVITKASSEDWDVISVSFDKLKKPPTPEQELDAKLYDFFQCNSKEDLAEAIINGEIEGLEYKPQ